MQREPYDCSEPVEVLGEVLHHVVALRLAVHDDVEADLLLEVDDALDLRLHPVEVVGLGDDALRELRAGTPDVRGLRERSDGRRRQERQLQRLVLGGQAGRVLPAAEVRAGQGGFARTYGLHPDAGRRGTVCESRGGRAQLVLDRLVAVDDPAREDGDLADLLIGERQPALQARVQLRLVLDVVRHVQEGGGGRHGDVGAEREQTGERAEGRFQVAAPDVVAVDDPADQGRGRQRASRGRVERAGDVAAHQVERDRLDGRDREHREGVVEASVGRRDEDRRSLGRTAQGGVGGTGGLEHLCALLVDALRDERGLVQLHPRSAGGSKTCEQVRVDRQQVGEPGQRAEALRRLVARLAQEQEGDRSDDHGPGDEARGAGLLELADDPVGREPEHGLRADLGNEVVVVRVEPLRHLQRRLLALAARDGEVAGQVDGAAVTDEVRETRRDGANCHRGVEHLVVEAEALRDRGIVAAEAQRREPLPGRRAQPGRCRLQLVGGEGARPEALHGLLELSATADPGVADDGAHREGGACGGGVGHAFSLSLKVVAGRGDVVVGAAGSSPILSRTDSTAACWLKV